MNPTTSDHAAHRATSSAAADKVPPAPNPAVVNQALLQAVVQGALERHAREQAEQRARAASQPLRARNAHD